MVIGCLMGLLVLVMTMAGAESQEENLIINVDNRKTYSLDGSWNIIVDPYEAGSYNYRYQPRENGYFRNQKSQHKHDLIEYHFDSSDSLHVPGDWNTQREQLFFYEGTIWFKKSFQYQISPERRLFVYFGAVNYHAVVYLNGERIGEHVGGFTPFNFEITSDVKDGDNFLIVKVDNIRHHDAVPTLMTDWWNYGGLTRRVMLIEVPETFVRDYFVQLRRGYSNKIAGWVQLDGSIPQQSITIYIPDSGMRHNFSSDENGYASFQFEVDVNFWSPDDPHAYTVWVITETDTIQDLIGFRSIEVQGKTILLNDEPTFLRGISIHEESPLHGGRACTVEDVRMLLGWAKELGCNFVRLAHYPHNEFMIREADKMGLMIWAEIPVYWTILWNNPATFQNASQQLSEMIARDKNRASVILWSVANETPRGKERLQFLKDLIEQARNLDQTRLVTAATELTYRDTILMVDDPLGEHLDVIGANEYVGWYGGMPEDAPSMTWETVYDKPLIISEFGGGALAGYHEDSKTRWTEEYQENLYRNQIHMLKKIPFLRGVSPWILVDFRSPRRPLPKIQDFWNRKGLISDQGQKKKAFYVLKEFYDTMEKLDR